MNATNDVRVLCNSGAEIETFAGVLGAGAGGLGVSIAVPTITNTTIARITGANTNGGETTEVRADSSENVDIKIGTVGLGVVGVAGSVGVASISSVTNALINSGSRTSTVNQNPAYATAVQDVFVTADDNAALTDDTGSAAGGLVGVGVAVSVGSITNQVNATIGASSQVKARRDVEVNAHANWNLDTFTVAFSGGYYASIAGAVSVIRIGGALDGQGASQAGTMQSDTNSQISMSSGARNLNTSDPTAQRAKTRTTTTRFSVSDNLQTAPLTAGEQRHCRCGR